MTPNGHQPRQMPPPPIQIAFNTVQQAGGFITIRFLRDNEPTFHGKLLSIDGQWLYVQTDDGRLRAINVGAVFDWCQSAIQPASAMPVPHLGVVQ